METRTIMAKVFDVVVITFFALLVICAIGLVVYLAYLLITPLGVRLDAFMTDCRAQEITQATCERLAIEFFGG